MATHDGIMVKIEFEKQIRSLYKPSIVNMLQAVELNRGKASALSKTLDLDKLHKISLLKNVASSNEIEGIRIKKRNDDEAPYYFASETKEEYLLSGYKRALETIFEGFAYQPLTEDYIKGLRSRLVDCMSFDFKAKYKKKQNAICEYDPKGNFIRKVFSPSKPEDVPFLMENLVFQFNEYIGKPYRNVLLGIFVFVLDFLCIHPFDDGNGRVSRLLTTFLLLKYGYDLDQYCPLSSFILNDVNAYYSCLERSSARWDAGNNDCSSFVRFMLLCLLRGYEKLAYISEMAALKAKAKEKVLKVINDCKGLIDKAGVEDILFGVSRPAIEKALGELTKEGAMQKIQGGKYAKYYKK